MDPFAAISLAGNIVGFIDFSAKLLSDIREIRDSGSTTGDKTLRQVTRDIQRLAKNLEACIPSTPLDPETAALKDLVSECQDVAEDLLEVLENVQASDPTSKRQSAKAALKRLWNSKEMRDMQQRLDILSHALDRRFQEAFRTEMRNQLGKVLESGRSQEANMESLRKHVESVRHGVVVASLDNKALHQLREIVSLSDQAVLKGRQSLVLQALEFDGMDERYSHVEKAHEETFNWIFDLSNNFGSARGEQLKAASDFDKFLRGDSVIFRVLGKAGSGKSTLMKFLSRHPQTELTLREWAGERQLLIAKYFFWRPGSKMQKSIEGLIRSLLHSILQRMPGLIPEIFPELWIETEKNGPLHRMKLDVDDVKNAFNALITSSGAGDSYRFAFFIDGLDEYEPEGYRSSYIDLARLLKSWCRAKPGEVKICFSSREYPVFDWEFADCPGLRLQSLTRNDMIGVVHHVLHNSRPFKSLALSEEQKWSFVMKTLDCSDGVFLWLTIVLRNLENGIINGDTFDAALKRLLALPTELDDLFMNLLRSISAQDQPYCFSILRIVKETSGILGLTPLMFSCIDMQLESRDGHASISESDFMAGETGPELELWKHKGSPQMRRRVEGRFHGLLEVFPRNASGAYVQFVHRSLHDFLTSQKAIEVLGYRYTDFDWCGALFVSLESMARILTSPRFRQPSRGFWVDMIQSLHKCGSAHLTKFPESAYASMERTNAILSQRDKFWERTVNHTAFVDAKSRGR